MKLNKIEKFVLLAVIGAAVSTCYSAKADLGSTFEQTQTSWGQPTKVEDNHLTGYQTVYYPPVEGVFLCETYYKGVAVISVYTFPKTWVKDPAYPRLIATLDRSNLPDGIKWQIADPKYPTACNSSDKIWFSSIDAYDAGTEFVFVTYMYNPLANPVIADWSKQNEKTVKRAELVKKK